MFSDIWLVYFFDLEFFNYYANAFKFILFVSRSIKIYIFFVILNLDFL